MFSTKRKSAREKKKKNGELSFAKAYPTNALLKHCRRERQRQRRVLRWRRASPCFDATTRQNRRKIAITHMKSTMRFFSGEFARASPEPGMGMGVAAAGGCAMSMEYLPNAGKLDFFSF
jgi:hypothetical protein